MPKKKTTIEDLAVLVKKGFDQTATKDDLREVKSDVKELKEQVVRLSADVAKLKDEVRRDDPFVEDLLRRVRVVEKRMGLISN